MPRGKRIAILLMGPVLWAGIGWNPAAACGAGRAGMVRYDAEGIRWQKVVGGAQVTTYLVDRNLPFQQVLEERDGAGTVTASYVYLDDLVAAAFAGVGTRFYGYDGQMSTRFLTDTGANVTDSYTFDAWGGTLASAGATPNNYLYTGEQFDPNIGFQYNRARYLDDSTGRWLSQDPMEGRLSDPASLHQYSYTSANPANRLDPSGLTTGLIETTTVQSIQTGLVAHLAFSILITLEVIKLTMTLAFGIAVLSAIRIATEEIGGRRGFAAVDTSVVIDYENNNNGGLTRLIIDFLRGNAFFPIQFLASDQTWSEAGATGQAVLVNNFGVNQPDLTANADLVNRMALSFTAQAGVTNPLGTMSYGDARVAAHAIVRPVVLLSRDSAHHKREAFRVQFFDFEGSTYGFGAVWLPPGF